MNKILIATVLFGSLCFGQQNENQEVEKTIRNLFLGMKNADPELVKSTFSDTAILQTITKSGLKNEELKDFLGSISKYSKNDLDERIVIDVIRTDGDLASVFTPYEFFFKGKFSHCGVNSFQLVKQNGEWKIQYLIDTRRKDNCKEIK